jgi:hypothetical protein
MAQLPLDIRNREQGAAQRDCAKERSVVLLHVGARPVGRRGGSKSPDMRRQDRDASLGLGGNKGVAKPVSEGGEPLFPWQNFGMVS